MKEKQGLELNNLLILQKKSYEWYPKEQNSARNILVSNPMSIPTEPFRVGT